MNLFMKLNNKKLSLMLLLSLSSQAYCHSEPTTHTEDTQTTSKNQLNVNVSEQEDAQYAELHNNLITQINMIESALDTIGQVRANIRGFQEKNSNELSEDEITQLIIFLHTSISSFKDDNVLYTNKEQVIKMTFFIGNVTDVLDSMITNGFSKRAKCFTPKTRSVVINNDTIKTLQPQDIQKLIKEYALEASKNYSRYSLRLSRLMIG